VEKAVQIILSDPQVQCVFVNIFGGIVRCDRVAEGILAAMRGREPRVPFVIRLTGTHGPEAQAILAAAGPAWQVTDDLAAAATRVAAVIAAGEGPAP